MADNTTPAISILGLYNMLSSHNDEDITLALELINGNLTNFNDLELILFTRVTDRNKWEKHVNSPYPEDTSWARLLHLYATFRETTSLEVLDILLEGYSDFMTNLLKVPNKKIQITYVDR
jgi:hypothetical protein